MGCIIIYSPVSLVIIIIIIKIIIIIIIIVVAAREKHQLKKACVQQTGQHTMQTANSLKRAHKREEKKIALEVKMEKKRQQTRERVKKFREKRKQTTDAREADDCDGNTARFTNRMVASRAVRKVTKSLPETPKKRAEIKITARNSKPRCQVAKMY